MFIIFGKEVKKWTIFVSPIFLSWNLLEKNIWHSHVDLVGAATYQEEWNGCLGNKNKS